jgi:hypothetical protein
MALTLQQPADVLSNCGSGPRDSFGAEPRGLAPKSLREDVVTRD